MAETLTVQVAFNSPSSEVAVIVAVPSLIPSTTPLLETLAMVSSELFHVTFLFEAFSGVYSTVSVEGVPMVTSVWR